MDIPCAAIMNEKKKNSMITHAFSSNISLIAIMEFFYHFYIISEILFFIWIRLEMISCHSTNTHSVCNGTWMKQESHANMLNVGSLMVSENHFFLSIVCHVYNGLFLSRSQPNDLISPNVPLSHFKWFFVSNKYCYHSILLRTA